MEKINNEKPDELNKHPLEDLEGVPKLTDLQRKYFIIERAEWSTLSLGMITSAILIHGEPCPFDKMAEFISQVSTSAEREKKSLRTTLFLIQQSN